MLRVPRVLRGGELLEPTHVAAGAASRWNVGVEPVVHYHPTGTEAPAKRANCALHACNPIPRQAVLVALVVLRNHLVAQDFEKRFAVSKIVQLNRRVRLAAADGGPVQPLVGFRPPPGA